MLLRPLLALSWFTSSLVLAASPSLLRSIAQNERELFNTTMTAFDANFNATSGILFDSVRYSIWYAVGLLGRNAEGDVKRASSIIRNGIASQYKDPTKIWFGTFPSSPETPDPNTVASPLIYTTYDPNIRGFITTSLIIALEEFEDLLEPSLVSLIEESIYNATVGDGYRVGGWYGDNLYPVYSNPWLMRCAQTIYVGHRLGNTNMTHWGNIFMQEAVDLFDQYGTLSEFNSPTYTGVSLYALTLGNRYAPAGSVMRKHAARMITGVWETIGQLYNPTLKNLGGPWDRTYGYDMTGYFSILGAQISGLIGQSSPYAPLPSPLEGSNHWSDAAIAPLLALISPSHDPRVPAAVIRALTNLSESHAWRGSAYSPPFDFSVPGSQRNYSAWTEAGLSMGAMEIDEALVGGPAINNQTFNPAVIQWDAGGAVRYISLFPTENHILAHLLSSDSGTRTLAITYPAPNATASPTTLFTLIVGPPQNLSMSLATSNASAPRMSFAGLEIEFGGNASTAGALIVGYNASQNINGFEYINVSLVVPQGFVRPTLELSVRRV